MGIKPICLTEEKKKELGIDEFAFEKLAMTGRKMGRFLSNARKDEKRIKTVKTLRNMEAIEQKPIIEQSETSENFYEYEEER